MIAHFQVVLNHKNTISTIYDFCNLALPDQKFGIRVSKMDSYTKNTIVFEKIIKISSWKNDVKKYLDLIFSLS
jgi:hypothetical protein